METGRTVLIISNWSWWGHIKIKGIMGKYRFP